MMKQKRYILGFTLVELSVVMIVFSVITAVLIAFYMEAQQHLSRGIAQTTLQQKTRNAAVRIIPKIASAIYRPETTIIKNGSPVTLPALKAITKPAVSINDSNPPDTDSDSPIPSTYSREICLTSVRPFIEDQLARSPTEMTQAASIRDSFDPRNINYEQYRIWFEKDTSWKDPNGLDTPGGQIGDVWLSKSTSGTPANKAKDIRLVGGLYDVIFENLPDNTVRLTIIAKGWMRRAVGGMMLNTQVYQTRIFLPVFTYSPGGT